MVDKKRNTTRKGVLEQLIHVDPPLLGDEYREIYDMYISGKSYEYIAREKKLTRTRIGQIMKSIISGSVDKVKVQEELTNLRRATRDMIDYLMARLEYELDDEMLEEIQKVKELLPKENI